MAETFKITNKDDRDTILSQIRRLRRQSRRSQHSASAKGAAAGGAAAATHQRTRSLGCALKRKPKPPKHGAVALLVAAANNRADSVCVLLAAGVNINSKQVRLCACLDFLCDLRIESCKNCCRLSVLHCISQMGQAALLMAAAKNSVAVVSVLLAHPKVDVNITAAASPRADSPRFANLYDHMSQCALQDGRTALQIAV